MDVYECIKTRRSIRGYKPDLIPEATLKRLLNAMRSAPSAKNYQPWKFIVIRDEVLKRKLIKPCNNQKFIVEAPILIVGCAFEDDCFAYMGNSMASYPVDLAIAFTHLTLAAASEGIGTCWIGSFDEDDVKTTLNLPSNVRVVALMPVGYPRDNPAPKARKQLEDIVSYDGWD